MASYQELRAAYLALVELGVIQPIDRVSERLKDPAYVARRIAAEERRRIRHRDREAKRRRSRGAKPRAEYEAQSISRAKPWEALGISRRTWFRRRKQANRLEQER